MFLLKLVWVQAEGHVKAGDMLLRTRDATIYGEQQETQHEADATKIIGPIMSVTEAFETRKKKKCKRG